MKATLGHTIYTLRKKNGMTQTELAARLGVTFQAISKWETNVSLPDVALLPALAGALGCSIDGLLGYTAGQRTGYEDKYKAGGYYWGTRPSAMCYEVMKRLPPERPLRLLDIGCGEGKDAVFFARNGYAVTAIDASPAGIAKGEQLAAHCGVPVNFICADLQHFHPENSFDIVFSSGVLQYIPPAMKDELMTRYKACTAPGGLHAMNVFVEKPFIPQAPDRESGEICWRSGELMGFYADWRIDGCDEVIFSCTSSGTPHMHCMDKVYAGKPAE